MLESQTGQTAPSAPGFGVTWGGPPRAAGRALTVAAAAAVIAGIAGPAAAAPAPASSADRVSVIVQELPGSGNGPERAVAGLGGEVVRSYDVIDGSEASLPGDRLGLLHAVPGVKDVTPNAAMSLSSAEVDQQVGLNGSMRRVTHEMTGAASMWDAGFTGAGVDVAVIDSGTAPCVNCTSLCPVGSHPCARRAAVPGSHPGEGSRWASPEVRLAGCAVRRTIAEAPCPSCGSEALRALVRCDRCDRM